MLLILYSIALGKVSRLNASEKLIGADLELFLFTLQYDCRFASYRRIKLKLRPN